MTGEIWLGDLARALADIQPRTADDVRAIARLLGLAVPGQDSPRGTAGGPGDLTGPRATDQALADTVRAGDSPGGRDITPAAAPADGDLPVLELLGRRPIRPTGWGVRVLPRPPAGPVPGVPERAPLLAPRGAAATLQALAARSAPDGPLDVPAVVEALARRQVPRSLPRQARPTLRFGVEVLVDRGALMRPFTGDQGQVLAQVRAVVGEQLTSVRYFADAPGRGAGPGSRRGWQPYEPPEPGTRVLVLSNFGLAGPLEYVQRAEPEEWRLFLGDLRRQGCDAVGLVPLPADRWPSWLSALMPLVCWDRATTVSRVAAAMRGR